MEVQKRKAFCFVGNRQYIRTEEELLLINKEQADLAFKQYKKEIIDNNNLIYKPYIEELNKVKSNFIKDRRE